MWNCLDGEVCGIEPKHHTRANCELAFYIDENAQLNLDKEALLEVINRQKAELADAGSLFDDAQAYTTHKGSFWRDQYEAHRKKYPKGE